MQGQVLQARPRSTEVKSSQKVVEVQAGPKNPGKVRKCLNFASFYLRILNWYYEFYSTIGAVPFWPETCPLFSVWPHEGHKSTLWSIVSRDSSLSTTIKEVWPFLLFFFPIWKMVYFFGRICSVMKMKPSNTSHKCGSKRKNHKCGLGLCSEVDVMESEIAPKKKKLETADLTDIYLTI